MINIVCLTGRITKDPEVILKPKGEGEYIRFEIVQTIHGKAEYFKCVCFHRSTIGYIKRYYKKGCLVFIKGMLTTYEYSDPTGNRIARYSIVVDKDQAQLIKPPKAEDTSVIQQEIGVPGDVEEKQTT